MRAEVFDQAFLRIRLLKDPFIQRIRIEFTSELFTELALMLPLEDHLGRLETHQKLVGILAVALGRKKFTRRNIQKGESILAIGQMDCPEKIVGVELKQFLVGGSAGRNHFSNASFSNALGCFGIFKLVAYSHPVPC